MSYIEEFEREFRTKLRTEADDDTLVRWASERVLASYLNGITAAARGERVKRQGTSRRRGTSGKAE